MTLTLKFDLLLKNFNLGNNLWTVKDRAFINCTCVFFRIFVTRPFAPYHNFRLNDLDIELWMTFTKCCYFNLVASRRTSLSYDNFCSVLTTGWKPSANFTFGLVERLQWHWLPKCIYDTNEVHVSNNKHNEKENAVKKGIWYSFYAPGLKGPPGASSNRIVRPFVCNSIPLTNSAIFKVWVMIK